MMQLQLPDEFNQELKKTIGEAYKTAVEEAKRDIGINVEYLSKQQALELYGLSNNTLMDVWVPSGLEMYRVNGKIYFSKKKINQFIEQHKI